MELDAVQLRILGALIEKEITTPDGYPLSLNALVNACNQRSNRDPVTELSEEQIRQGLHALADQGLTAVARDARVAKYEHLVRTVWNLRRDETALLCLLMLRGPQTPGELRARSDRLYAFGDLEEVDATLRRLASRPQLPEGDATAVRTAGPQATGPMVAVLPKQPGSREARWIHLLGRPGTVSLPQAGSASVDPAAAVRESDITSEVSTANRLSALERELAALRTAVEAIEARLAGAISEQKGGEGGQGGHQD